MLGRRTDTLIYDEKLEKFIITNIRWLFLQPFKMFSNLKKFQYGRYEKSQKKVNVKRTPLTTQFCEENKLKQKINFEFTFREFNFLFPIKFFRFLNIYVRNENCDKQTNFFILISFTSWFSLSRLNLVLRKTFDLLLVPLLAIQTKLTGLRLCGSSALRTWSRSARPRHRLYGLRVIHWKRKKNQEASDFTVARPRSCLIGIGKITSN